MAEKTFIRSFQSFLHQILLSDSEKIFKMYYLKFIFVSLYGNKSMNQIKTIMTTDDENLEMFSFDQIKDEFIGEIGTERRTQYEQGMETYTLEQVTDELIGKKGTPERDLFEYELQVESLTGVIPNDDIDERKDYRDFLNEKYS